jgi:diguanylate cyclase (GGDEF)-like protein
MLNLSLTETSRKHQESVGPGVATGHWAAESLSPEDLVAQRAADRVRHLASTDTLTGLANHSKCLEAVASEIKRSERTGRAFAVLIFDLNGMKLINGRFGHPAGNCVLCRLADILDSSCRSIDTVARYGGDEFALVLPETGTKEANAVGRRLCERLANDREEPRLSMTVGVAIYPEDGTSNGTLFQAADRALYKMKHPESSL